MLHFQTPAFTIFAALIPLPSLALSPAITISLAIICALAVAIAVMGERRS
jgi:hypothetical protein